MEDAAKIHRPQDGEKWDFAQFDSAQVCISIGTKPLVCRGKARFERDATLGNILRIPIEGDEQSGAACVIVAEQEYAGNIEPDSRYGCQYRFLPLDATAAF